MRGVYPWSVRCREETRRDNTVTTIESKSVRVDPIHVILRVVTIRGTMRIFALLTLFGGGSSPTGMSLRVDNLPVLRVSRSSTDPADAIPGDRQRFTVAHEIGHLVLHAGLEAPLAPTEANRREQEAHRFASAFLAPGDAVLDDLHRLGGRVTLSTLTRMKEKWGYSVKAFVVRFRQLGVIDDDHARSLYKQISARRWNKVEPVAVGNESAVWFSKAASQMGSIAGTPATRSMSLRSGLGEAYFHRWMEWSPRQSEAQSLASVSKLTPRKPAQSTEPQAEGSISFLPYSRRS